MLPQYQSTRQRSAFRRFLNRQEVDRAVFFAIAARAWQVAAGPVTLFLIAEFFSNEMQGFFYAFGFLLAFNTLAELGMGTVVLYGASHEWHALSLAPDGRIQGDWPALERLAQLSKFVCKWYEVLSLLSAAIIVPLGLWYLARRDVPGIEWQVPWVVVALVTSANLALAPRVTLLEGCHQVSTVNGMRLIQGVAGNLAVWTVLASGGGLWTAVASAVVKLFVELWLVWGWYARFFESLRNVTITKTFPWKESVWPLQWRLALNSVLNYITTWIFTFAAFEQQGLIAAGQTGMTWTVLTALQSVTLAWVQTRVPLFGSLVARGSYRELDRVFLRVSKISILLMGLGSLVVVAGVLTMEAVHRDLFRLRTYMPQLATEFADKVFPRILPTLPTAFYCLALVGINIALCLALYVRAHKTDPFLPFNLVSAGATSILIWFSSLNFGPTGAAAALLAGVITTTLPFHWLVWKKIREGHPREMPSGGRIQPADG